MSARVADRHPPAPRWTSARVIYGYFRKDVRKRRGKLVEYMAAGLCPVASDQPEIRELLGGGERGVLVPPGDAGALAQALVELARDRERTKATGLRAREYVLAARSWHRNAERALRALKARPAELVA